MSLVGNLEDLPLADIFQIIELSSKSGVLQLSQEASRKAWIVFNSGAIVGAWSPKSVAHIESLLGKDGLTVPGSILRMNPQEPDPIHVVRKALSAPFLPPERQVSILENLTRMTLFDLVQWKTGTFHFELQSESNRIQDWTMVEAPISSDYAGIEGARINDEVSEGLSEQLQVPPTEALVDIVEELQDQFEPSSAPEPRPMSPGLDLLKGMLFELHLPNVHTYITLLVLRYASALMNRAVLFEVKEDAYVGLGEFGLTPEKEESARLVRDIQIPRNQDSVLSSVEEGLQAVKRPPDSERKLDQKLIKSLGGQWPSEVFLGPLVCEGRLVAILYGDNLPEKKAIGETETLEIFLSQAGITMEKALLSGHTTAQSLT